MSSIEKIPPGSDTNNPNIPTVGDAENHQTYNNTIEALESGGKVIALKTEGQSLESAPMTAQFPEPPPQQTVKNVYL